MKLLRIVMLTCLFLVNAALAIADPSPRATGTPDPKATPQPMYARSTFSFYTYENIGTSTVFRSRGDYTIRRTKVTSYFSLSSGLHIMDPRQLPFSFGKDSGPNYDAEWGYYTLTNVVPLTGERECSCVHSNSDCPKGPYSACTILYQESYSVNLDQTIPCAYLNSSSETYETMREIYSGSRKGYRSIALSGSIESLACR